MDEFELAKKYFLEGIGHLEEGIFEEAESKFWESLKLAPNRVSTLINLSATQIKLQKYAEAKITAEHLLTLEANNFEAYLNLGIIAKEAGHFMLAIEHFTKAIHINPYIDKAHLNNGTALKDLKQYDKALAAYDRAIAINPAYPDAWSNKGVVYADLKQYDKALAAYDRAIAINPAYPDAWSNKGVVYADLKQYDKALAAYDRVLNISPSHADAWANKGVLYGALKQYDMALAAYDQALRLKPNSGYVLGHYIFTKMLVGDWKNLDSMATTLSKGIDANLKMAAPFATLPILKSPRGHLKASEIWINDKHPTNYSLPPIPKKIHKKIKLGYFSADFSVHPVSILTRELFELHSRENFEVIAFSLRNPGANDLMRNELIRTFDEFIDVENKSDIEIAKLARDIEIDIAIDLGGHTEAARTGIFSYRAAPIQVNYLGYAGTIGAKYIDYIIADHIVIPESNRLDYTEKIAYLPDTYMVDDSKRKIGEGKFNKEDFNLPTAGFIFCSFNNSYKFNPRVVKSWAKIILNVPESILWISENNQLFQKNICSQFQNMGVDPQRIIFAKRLEAEADHLQRYQLADLFLDTSPYNSHTTAIDALRAGLPIVTLLGEAFAGRAAASILSAVGMQKLIANTWDEYESLAIRLARHPKELKELKVQLQENINIKPLFNTALFKKNLETAYLKMYERYQIGLEPDHIDVKNIK